MYVLSQSGSISGMGQLNLNESIDSNPAMQHPVTSLPLASGGSGGSSGHGIWGANMPSQQPLDQPIWGTAGGLNSTYGGGQIYNPAAPPPSANYFGFDNTRGSGGSGSGSHRSNNRLILAGSGSGSDSDRASNVMGSDRSSLLRNPGLRSGT